MKISSERIPEAQTILEVEIDEGRLQKSLDDASRRLAQRVRIPGFRKGKAPRAVIERTLGASALFDEAAERLVGEAYDEAIKQEGIQPIGPPQFEIVNRDPMRFKATVPLQPIVDLGDYQEITAESPAVDVSEEMVEQSLLEIRRRYAVLEPVERPARLNDRLIADIRADLDGDTVLNEIGAEFHLRENITIALPGVDQALLGLEQGQEHRFDITVDDDWHDEDVAGKSVEFFVTIHEIKEEILPEADDDLATEVGEFDSFIALRSQIYNDLMDAAKKQTTEAIRDDVLRQAVERATVEFPPMLIERETEHMIRELAQRSGQNPQEYMNAQGDQVEAILGEIRGQAHDRVLRSLVIDQVARVEGIEITEEDVEQEIVKMSGDGPQADQIRNLFSNDNSRAMLRRNLLSSRSLERLTEIALAGDGVEASENDEDLESQGVNEQELHPVSEPSSDSTGSPSDE